MGKMDLPHDHGQLFHCEEYAANPVVYGWDEQSGRIHYLKQLWSAGLIVNRRDGKEVYYTAVDTEQARLLHQMIEELVKNRQPLPKM